MSGTRPALRLLPTCATTGIGSLPHSQGELALQMALQHDVPYLPQLPHGSPSELMIPAALDGLPGLVFDDDGLCVIDVPAFRAGRDALRDAIESALTTGNVERFEPSLSACRSLRPFLFEVQARKLAFAKAQLTGPLTARWVPTLSDGRPVADEPGLERQIYRLTLAKAVALAKAIRKAGATPIIYLDEPGLYALQRDNVHQSVALKELSLLVAAVQQEGALVGIHCCGNTDWPRVMALGIDILSIDARLSLDAVLEDRDAFLRFISSGATLSLGIVPTDLKSTYTLDELVDSVEASLRAAAPPGVPFEAILSRALLTPACGLAMRSVIDAEHVIEQVRQAQKRCLALVAAP